MKAQVLAVQNGNRVFDHLQLRKYGKGNHGQRVPKMNRVAQTAALPDDCDECTKPEDHCHKPDCGDCHDHDADKRDIKIDYYFEGERDPVVHLLARGTEEVTAPPPAKTHAAKVMHPRENLLIYNKRIPEQILALQPMVDSHRGISVDLEVDRQWGWARIQRVIHTYVDIAFGKLGSPEETNRIFAEDLLDMLCEFMHVETHPNHIKLRIEIATQQGCLKFHKDTVRMRAIRTYIGHGTEYAVNEDVDRNQLRKHIGVSWKIANSKIVPDASKIQVTAPGDIMYMKGSGLDGYGGLVHRSPPKTQWKTKRRLLVKIDTGCGCC